MEEGCETCDNWSTSVEVLVLRVDILGDTLELVVKRSLATKLLVLLVD